MKTNNQKRNCNNKNIAINNYCYFFSFITLFCSDFCSIDGICYDESQTEVGRECLICQPKSTRTNWTLKTSNNIFI